MTEKSAVSLVTAKANPQPVGSTASANKVKTMLKLSIELKLSAAQIQALIGFVMLFFS